MHIDNAEMSARARAVHKLKNEFYPAVAAGIPSAQDEWPANPPDIGRMRERSYSKYSFFRCIQKFISVQNRINGLRLSLYIRMRLLQRVSNIHRWYIQI